MLFKSSPQLMGSTVTAVYMGGKFRKNKFGGSFIELSKELAWT